MNRLRTREVWLASALLAMVFVAWGIRELAIPSTGTALVSLGLPGWIPALLALSAIGGGLMLVVPRISWYGALWLGVLATAHAGVCLWSGQRLGAAVATGVLAPVMVLGYLRHPRASLMQRLRAVTDAVAEREIAAYQDKRSWAAAQEQIGSSRTSSAARAAHQALAATVLRSAR